MELNEIKKALYKENLDAWLSYIRSGVAYYYCELGNEKVYFDIPVSDMGDADFGSTMKSKFLIRWLRK